jgi:hypothetical protein
MLYEKSFKTESLFTKVFLRELCGLRGFKILKIN